MLYTYRFDNALFLHIIVFLIWRLHLCCTRIVLIMPYLLPIIVHNIYRCHSVSVIWWRIGHCLTSLSASQSQSQTCGSKTGSRRAPGSCQTTRLVSPGKQRLLPGQGWTPPHRHSNLETKIQETASVRTQEQPNGTPDFIMTQINDRRTRACRRQRLESQKR